MDAVAFRIVLHTRDFDRMLDFYQDILGMEYVRGWDRPDSRGVLLSPGREMGSTTIEILELGNLTIPDAQPVNVELSIEVKEVAEWHQRLQNAGIKIARGIEDMPWGHRSFGVDDPEGLRIWLYEVIERDSG